MTSGRLYSAVTKSWPRIAAGLVIVIGLVEFVVGGLTADSGLELYLLAWAATTAGVWFLFEKAESTLSQDVRDGVTNWFRPEDVHSRAWAIPEQFAALFDMLFTPRHWSRECFNRSCLASLAAVVAVLALQLSVGAWARYPTLEALSGYIVGWGVAMWGLLFVATVVVRSRGWRFVLGVVFLTLFLGPGVLARMQDQLVVSGPIAGLDVEAAALVGGVFSFAVMMNFIPDYASLLETRLAIRWMGGTGRLGRLLVVDALITAFMSLLFIGTFYAVVMAPSTGREFVVREFLLGVVWPPSAPFVTSDELSFSLLSISFYSAFFTSAWLWLYALGTVLARLLVRINSGVGFLLRVTDVENQPFRSMGFVSVLIVSCLFALGLPLVLL